MSPSDHTFTFEMFLVTPRLWMRVEVRSKKRERPIPLPPHVHTIHVDDRALLPLVLFQPKYVVLAALAVGEILVEAVIAAVPTSERDAEVALHDDV